MKRRASLALVSALLALGAGLWLVVLALSHEDGAATAAPVARAQLEAERATAELAAGTALLETRTASETHARPAEPEPSVASEPAPAQVEARPARDAQGRLDLLVQDRHGAAIADATVILAGLRSQDSPGSGFHANAWGGTSARDGSVTLAFPLWVDDELRTSRLTLRVSHPDYEAKLVDDVSIEDGPQVVVLERGAFLVVSGWIESPGELVREVVPHLSDEARIAPGSWIAIQDGRLSNATIPPGPHALWLEHRAADGRLYFSEVEPFELARDTQHELHLRLVPARTLAGRLESEVPRPVEEGRVLLNLLVGARGAGPKAMRSFRADVRSDGSFELADLPPGEGQIVAACSGWISERVDGGAAALGVREGDPEAYQRALESGAWRAWLPQSVEPASVEGVFELAMEPVASLEATLLGPDGAPVEGAMLALSPNVLWRNGYATIFLDRGFHGTSDAEGRVRIDELPAGICLYSVTHARLGLPVGSHGIRAEQVELHSGETAKLALELVPLD